MSGAETPRADGPGSWNDPRVQDMTFFGAVAASISHELNNVLGTINELCGLLTDLLGVGEAGRPVDPARLRRPLERIGAQIARGHAQTTKLNQFGHSVDRDRSSIALGDAVEQCLALCERFAAMKKTELVVDGSDRDARIEGRVFDLLHVLYRMVVVVLAGASAGDSIRVSWSREGDHVTLTAAGGAARGDDPPEAKAARATLAAVAEKIGGSVRNPEDAHAAAVAVTLPRVLSSPSPTERGDVGR